MKKPRRIWALLFASFLLLAGCIDTPTKEDRLACLELASYSFAHIPECSTQEKCYTQAQAAFGVDEGAFSQDVGRDLFSAKSHISRSWLFLNNARENLRKIHAACESESFAQIPQLANELSSNLLVFGSEQDLFSESAARAIALEAQDLQAQDVNLAPQSLLFDDYALLNQNMIDFAQKNSRGSTYASRQILEMEKFSALASGLGIAAGVQEKNAFGLLAQNSSTLSGLVKAGGKDFPIGLMLPVLRGTSEFLSGFFSLQGSVSSLKKIPASPIFGAMNNLAGSQNSAAAEFFSLFRDDSAHRAKLREDNAQRKENAQKSLLSSREVLDALREKHGTQIRPELLLMPPSGFGTGDFNGQGSGRGSSQDNGPINGQVNGPVDGLGIGIATTTLPLSGLADYYESMGGRIEQAQAGLRLVEQAEFLHSMGLGALSRKISDYGKEALEISSGLGALEGSLSGINESCSQRLGYIAGQISSPQFNTKNPIAVSIMARIKSRADAFLAQKDYGDCKGALELYDELLDYLDSSQGEQAVASEIDACIISSDRLLAIGEDAGIGNQLDSLRRIERPYENPDLVLASCSSIRERLLLQVRKSSVAAAALAGFIGLSEKIPLVESIVESFPALPSQGKANESIGAFEKISAFFEDSTSNQGRALKEGFLESSEAQKISGRISSQLETLGQLLPELAGQAAEKYAKIEFANAQWGTGAPGNYSGTTGYGSYGENGYYGLPGNNGGTGDVNHMQPGAGSLALISVFNSGVKIPAGFSATIPLDSSMAEKVFSTGNISFLPQGRRTELVFSSFLPGVNSIILDLNPARETISGPAPENKGPDENALARIEERASIVAQKNLLLEKAKGLDAQPEDAIALAGEKIELLAAQGRLGQAGAELKKLQDGISEFESEKENSAGLGQNARALLEKSRELAALGGSLQEKVSLLEANFSDLRKDELEQVYAFSPITTGRLRELKELAAKAAGEGGGKSISEKMDSLISAGQFREAIALAQKEGLEFLGEQAGGALKEADSAIARLRENALSSYGVAQSKRDPAKATEELDAKLLGAKQALEDGSYLKSILGSQQAIATGSAVLSRPEIPLAAYPIVLLIAGAALYIYRKAEASKKPEPAVRVRNAMENEAENDNEHGHKKGLV